MELPPEASREHVRRILGTESEVRRGPLRDDAFVVRGGVMEIPMLVLSLRQAMLEDGFFELSFFGENDLTVDEKGIAGMRSSVGRRPLVTRSRRGQGGPRPLRDPILDRVGHEAGHLAGMKVLGYGAAVATFDLRWGDYGHFGVIEGVRRRNGDPKREPYDRSVIGAVGPLLAGVDLDHPSAAADRRCIDLNRTDGWDLETWRWLMFERARDLARTEAFRSWRALVIRLADLGDEYVELRGDEVDSFLESVPDAGPLTGPRPLVTSLYASP